MTAANRAEQIAGLYELVDWLRDNPSVPLPWNPGINAYVENLDGVDKPTAIAMVRAAAAATGVNVYDFSRHLSMVKGFAGGVTYEALVCDWRSTADETSRAGDTDTSPEVPAVATTRPGTETLLGAGEVAGVAVGSAPATAAQPEHYHSGGTAGGLGENEAECACGVVFAGFDTHAEATAALDRHIAEREG